MSKISSRWSITIYSTYIYLQYSIPRSRIREYEYMYESTGYLFYTDTVAVVNCLLCDDK
jgi:hypothetical protein